MRALGLLALVACGSGTTSLGTIDAPAAAADSGAPDAAIAGPDATPAEVLAAIGRECDSSHPCAAGTICGPCGIATGQCVLACAASGTAGCPAGTYCSKAGSNRFWSGNYDAHFCVRLCNGDSECQTPTGNAGLSCNGSYDDDETSHEQICNVSNSIGSTHACP
jgi:hypothetical protein